MAVLVRVLVWRVAVEVEVTGTVAAVVSPVAVVAVIDVVASKEAPPAVVVKLPTGSLDVWSTSTVKLLKLGSIGAVSVFFMVGLEVV